MMDLKAKRVLIINLDTKHFEVKSFSELHKYIGGVAMGMKLFEMYTEQNPIIFCIGPLNGLFPYASKTCVILESSSMIEDLYVGGSLSSRTRLAGFDAIVLLNRASKKTILDIRDMSVHFKFTDSAELSELGLPGKRSVLQFEDEKVVVDHYFTTEDNYLEKALKQKNIEGIVISGTDNPTVPDFQKYKEVYTKLLERNKEMAVEKNTFPACAICPMGCEKSKTGEMGGDVLIHSLVACEFSKNIYSNVGIVFSCLNVLGYDYTHEDIENLQNLMKKHL